MIDLVPIQTVPNLRQNYCYIFSIQSEPVVILYFSGIVYSSCKFNILILKYTTNSDALRLSRMQDTNCSKTHCKYLEDSGWSVLLTD